MYLNLSLMFKKLFLLVVVALSTISHGQTQSFGIGLGNSFIQISNNYIDSPKANSKMVVNTSSPWEDQTYDVFGSKVVIAISPKEVMGSYSFLIRDQKLLPNYQLDKMEYQVLKNDKVFKPWSKVEEPPYEKTVKDGKETIKYFLVEDNLVDGDVVKISFRGANKKVFLNCILRKKTEDEMPFLYAIVHDENNESREAFIQSANKSKRYFNPEFYEDWPDRYQTESKYPIEKVTEKSRFALFFRPRKNKTTKDMLEYRVLENGEFSLKSWKTADDIIILDNFKPDNNYVLQVRYKGGSKIYEKEYGTKLNWYKTPWPKLIGFLVLLAASVFLYLLYRNKKIKRVQLEQESKLKLMAAQLNPHFIFNSLNSIQGLVNNNEIVLANQYLSEFAKLMRNVVDFGQQSLIPISEDIKALQHYLSLEKLRFNFKFDFVIDEAVSETTEVLPMLVQPIVENAVKHGVSTLAEDGLITVKIYKENDNLVYSIEDNGGGIQQQNEKGRGLQLVDERIALYNSTSKLVKISKTMDSSEKGTVVKVMYKRIFSND